VAPPDMSQLMYESRLQALDYIQQPAIVVDACSDRVVTANAHVCERLGYSPRELEGLPRSILFSRQSEEHRSAAERHGASPAGTGLVEVECLTRTGEQVPMTAVCQSLATESASPSLILVVLNEPRADGLPKRVGAVDKRVRALLDFAYDAYSDYDILTGYIDFSEQMDTMLGYPAGGAPRTFWTWAHLLHRDDRHRVLRSLKGCLAGDASTWSCEYRLRRRDGSYVLVYDQCIILMDEHGRKSHMVGAVRDITEERQAARALRESAELYRTLFVDAANPAFRVSESGRYVDVNEAGLRFFECTREEFLARHAYTDLPRELVRMLRTQRKDSIRRLEREIAVEVHETIKHLVVTVIPARIGGEVTHFCLGTDITALKTLQSGLEDSNRAMRVLIDQLHHNRDELRVGVEQHLATAVTPIIERLRHALQSRPEAGYVEALNHALGEVFHPLVLSEAKSAETLTLTRREAEIASFIRLGKTTDEIAEVLCLTPSAIQFHRSNIRRKLGLSRGGPQLGSYLASLDTPITREDRRASDEKR